MSFAFRSSRKFLLPSEVCPSPQQRARQLRGREYLPPQAHQNVRLAVCSLLMSCEPLRYSNNEHLDFLWIYGRKRISPNVYSNSPLSAGNSAKTPSECLILQIINNPIYAILFTIHTYIPEIQLNL